METILTILILYILGVAIYTYVVKNDALHKHSPHTNLKAIIIDGMKGMAIGFAVTGALYFALGQILTWIRY